MPLKTLLFDHFGTRCVKKAPVININKSTGQSHGHWPRYARYRLPVRNHRLRPKSLEWPSRPQEGLWLSNTDANYRTPVKTHLNDHLNLRLRESSDKNSSHDIFFKTLRRPFKLTQKSLQSVLDENAFVPQRSIDSARDAKSTTSVPTVICLDMVASSSRATERFKSTSRVRGRTQSQKGREPLHQTAEWYIQMRRIRPNGVHLLRMWWRKQDHVPIKFCHKHYEVQRENLPRSTFHAAMPEMSSDVE